MHKRLIMQIDVQAQHCSQNGAKDATLHWPDRRCAALRWAGQLTLLRKTTTANTSEASGSF